MLPTAAGGLAGAEPRGGLSAAVAGSSFPNLAPELVFFNAPAATAPPVSTTVSSILGNGFSRGTPRGGRWTAGPAAPSGTEPASTMPALNGVNGGGAATEASTADLCVASRASDVGGPLTLDSGTGAVDGQGNNAYPADTSLGDTAAGRNSGYMASAGTELNPVRSLSGWLPAVPRSAPEAASEAAGAAQPPQPSCGTVSEASGGMQPPPSSCIAASESAGAAHPPEPSCGAAAEANGAAQQPEPSSVAASEAGLLEAAPLEAAQVEAPPLEAADEGRVQQTSGIRIPNGKTRNQMRLAARAAYGRSAPTERFEVAGMTPSPSGAADWLLGQSWEDCQWGPTTPALPSPGRRSSRKVGLAILALYGLSVQCMFGSIFFTVQRLTLQIVTRWGGSQGDLSTSLPSFLQIY